MKAVDLSYALVSPAIWSRILQAASFQWEARRAPFFDTVGGLERLRTQADYNTGSISATSAWVLFAVGCYFGPARVLEIGTFIGRSAIALALGAEAAGVPCELHTCDGSNDIPLPNVTGSRIVQYPKTTSTDMLTQIAKRSARPRFDLLHVDGRLQDKDFALVRDLLREDAVIALDDFEGTEKGVANLMNLRAAKMFSDHTVVYPCDPETLRRHGLHDTSTTALLLPKSMVRLTAQ